MAIFLSSYLLLNYACQPPVQQHSKENLRLQVQAFDWLGVGYGSVYVCQVNEVSIGTLTLDTIRLTVLAGDTLAEQQLYHSLTQQQPLVIDFKQSAEQASYQLMPISGFVGIEKNMWLIEAINLKEMK